VPIILSSRRQDPIAHPSMIEHLVDATDTGVGQNSNRVGYCRDKFIAGVVQEWMGIASSMIFVRSEF